MAIDLFENAAAEYLRREAPLADRMRPRTLDEFIGQEDIVGPGKLLRRAIEADRLFSSIILWGPPGTGKTTLARIISHRTQSHFETLNAVMAGVADIRRIVTEARERRKLHRRRTIVLIDEIHRFNKAQQDALLPHVEDGTIILIGATTENPYFEVNSALISRSRLFHLRPLSEAEVQELMRRALADPERGYGMRRIAIDDDALAHLARVAGGDARNALNALELAVESTPPGPDGVVHIDLAVAQDSIQRRAVLYDKEGDAHYDTISAFIKSVRGSDPDAALYWLAKMVYAGEDPRFIMRRLLILAAEDVGLAEPMGLVVAAAASQALEWVGMPEGIFPLVEATLFLATAPKSNTTTHYFNARAQIEHAGAGEVPDHLKDANRDAKGLGHGKGYLYPHNFDEHWTPQNYLPREIAGMTFYTPATVGYEATVAERLERWRTAQRRALGIEERSGPRLNHDEVERMKRER
ncbi:MAG: AAA family ATPase [Anaerolineae bacterium]|nr:AAA family ATPase [Thermoflexales bacterium]MDW8408191.1 AAA family ATPase [Anaerolineae bacterium]